MFLLDHRTHPPGQRRGDASLPPEGSKRRHAPSRGPAGGPACPPPRTYLGADHKLPLKSLSLPFLRSETRGGKRCARIFVERILLEFPCDHRGERWRLRRQVQSWPRPPAKSCSVRGGRRGPRAGAVDRVSLPPAPPSPPPASPPSPRPRLPRAGLGCGSGGVVSLPPTSSHSLVFVAVGSPNAFLSTTLFHYIMSIM